MSTQRADSDGATGEVMAAEPRPGDAPRLTETSYIVLGLLEQAEPATPYDLKQLAQLSVFNFWSVPHTQLYTECARLTEAGLLDERREQSGRRRRIYRLTDAGRAELAQWRGQPTSALYEARDPGILKLFFGGDPGALAEAQLEGHRAKLAEFERTRDENPDMPAGMRLALESGIGHEREYIRFWLELGSRAPAATSP